jgi:hypothetical protein
MEGTKEEKCSEQELYSLMAFLTNGKIMFWKKPRKKNALSGVY